MVVLVLMAVAKKDEPDRQALTTLSSPLLLHPLLCSSPAPSRRRRARWRICFSVADVAEAEAEEGREGLGRPAKESCTRPARFYVTPCVIWSVWTAELLLLPCLFVRHAVIDRVRSRC